MSDIGGLPEKNDVPDGELVSAAQKGREDAFALLFQRYRAPLFAMVFRSLGQREEAEDVVQQVFLKAYRHIGHFRGQSKFYTWLYSIGLNQVRNHVRQRSSRRTVSLDELDPWGQGPARQWVEKGPTPEEQAQRGMDMEALRESLADLGEDQRTIFVWHYFQQLSLAEVAVRLGRPLGTVKVYLHRARRAIYKSLKDLDKRPRIAALLPPVPGRPAAKAGGGF